MFLSGAEEPPHLSFSAIPSFLVSVLSMSLGTKISAKMGGGRRGSGGG